MVIIKRLTYRTASAKANDYTPKVAKMSQAFIMIDIPASYDVNITALCNQY